MCARQISAKPKKIFCFVAFYATQKSSKTRRLTHSPPMKNNMPGIRLPLILIRNARMWYIYICFLSCFSCIILFHFFFSPDWLQARQTKALKDKYTNIKTNLRRQFAAEKASRKATGGGKEMTEWQPKSESMAELARLIAISIHGTSPKFDDDDDEGDENRIHDIQPIADTQESIVPSAEVQGENAQVLNISEMQVDSAGNIVLTTDGIVFTANSSENQPIGEKSIENENDCTASVSSGHSSRKNWAKYKPAMLRGPASAMLKRPSSAASSHSESVDSNDSLLMLKKKLIERELAMREEEHEKRLAQQIAEHDARMELIEAQKAELREKSELRQMKIKIISLAYEKKLSKQAKSSSSESDDY